MTGPRVLDGLDRRILNALEIAPRAPFSRIASVLGVSEKTVARRYQTLRSSGTVRILAQPQRIGRSGSAYWTLRIGCRPGTATVLADALALRGDTSWVSIGAGGAEVTCLATVVGAAREGLLHQLPRVSNVLTFSAHQILHRFPGRGEKDWIAGEDPLDDAQRAALLQGSGVVEPDAAQRVRLEPADAPLLDALTRDGRASWAALAESTGWSERQVAQRVAALVAGEAIHFHLDVADAAVGMHTVANVWFAVAPSALASVGMQLADHREVAFAAAVTGATNLMASVRCRDATALYEYLTTKVAAVDGVRSVETVPLLTQLKQAHFLIENGLIRDAARGA